MSNTCSSCGSTTGLSYTITTNSCTSYSTSYDASGITYTGPAMSCLEIETNTDLQTILEAINTKVCIEGGSWDFNFACLPTLCECTINSAQSFAEAISAQFCYLKGQYTTFIGAYGGTFPAYQAAVDDRFNDIENPALTISCASITNTDTLWQVLTKLGTKLCSINTALNPSGITNSCYTFSATTTNGAFQELIDWMCTLATTVNGINNTLPTFDNSETCISGVSSLYNTVVAIRNLLCTKPDFNSSAIETSCLSLGSTLQSAVTELVGATDYLLQSHITSVTGTGLSLNSTGSPCNGMELALDLSAITDTKVSVDASQTAGYLFDKLTAGTGIAITKIGSTPNKTVQIESTVIDTKEVKVNSSGAEGYLIDKITVADSVDGVIAFTKGNIGDTVQISAGLNYSTLASTILNTISSDVDLTTLFCNMACACNCGLTTPTTLRKVMLRIETMNTNDNCPVGLQVNQTIVPAAIYNGNITLAGSSLQVVDTGYFVINDVTLNPAFTIILENQTPVGDPGPIYYRIYTTLSNGTTPTTQTMGLPGDVNGELATRGDAITFAPFAPYSNGFYLGEIPSSTDVMLHIQLSNRSFLT
jgi:hypothetical protein